jgi:hypothetical protein
MLLMTENLRLEYIHVYKEKIYKEPLKEYNNIKYQYTSNNCHMQLLFFLYFFTFHEQGVNGFFHGLCKIITD